MRVIIAMMALAMSSLAVGQCQLFDFYGNPSYNPTWYHCTGTDYTLNIQAPNAIGAWTINWGDGSPIQGGANLTPGNSITHLYTATVDTYNVTFTEVASGCTVNGTMILEEATSASIQIPVGGLTQACAPQDMEFTNSSTNTSPNTVFTWNFGDGSPLETYDHTNWNQTISHTYQQNTVDCETVVTLTAQNACNTVQGGSSTATFNPIRIWDYDDADITPSDFVLCWPDNTVEYQNTSDLNCFFQGNIAQRYEYWNFGDHWGLGHDSIIPWSPFPPSTNHTVSYPSIGSYTVMLLDSNYCGIDTGYVTIDIVPPPSAGLSVSLDTICQGTSATFFNNSSAESNAWLINYGQGSGWEFMGASTASHVFNTPGDHNIGLVAYVSGAGSACTDTAWVDLYVRPSPTAVFTLSDDEACDVLTYNVTENSVNAVQWNWDMGNGNAYTLATPPDQTYTIQGNYTVSLTVESVNGCTHTSTEQVNVYRSPVASFSTNDMCLGEIAQFTDESSMNATDPILTYVWDLGDATSANGQSVSHLYNTGATYDVTLTTTTAHCADDTLVQLVVDVPPIVDFSMDINAGCSPVSVSFTDQSSGVAVYNWNFGDGANSASTSPTHVFTNTTETDTVYRVILSGENSFGCASADTAFVTVYGATTASFNSNATPGCAPYEADFFNTSTGAIAYSWDFGDGTALSTATNPTHLFENTTEFIQYYTVQLIAYNANGCNDTTSQQVISYPEPDFSFDLSSTSGCAPLLTTFPAVAGAVSYQWDFGDGSTGSGPTPSHVYENTGNTVLSYNARLIASNPFGCVDTAYSSIDVYPLPQAIFEPDPASGCSPVTLLFDDQSVLSVSNRWIFSPGDTLITPPGDVGSAYSNTTANPVNYAVVLQSTSAHGCVNSTSRLVTILPEVIADFSSETIGCAPLSIDFSNNSFGASFYEWTFGDGGVSVDANPTHVFTNTSSADIIRNVRLVSSNSYGCTDTTYSTITVHPSGLAQFEALPISGCSPLIVDYANTSLLADQSRWVLNPGDTLTSNATNLNYTYVNTGSGVESIPVTLMIETPEGCLSQTSQTITVYPEVTAEFSSLSEGCSPLEVEFNNQSTGASSYTWSLGAGVYSTDTNPEYTYINNSSATATYQVELLASNIYGCVDTAQHLIDVYPRPIAQFVSSTISGCSPLEISLENTSHLADESLWIYGNGDSLAFNGAEHNVTYVNPYQSPVNYTTRLEIISAEGCTSSFEQQIEVFPAVTADFNMISDGCAPLEVAYENNSQGASSYTWAFGDGLQDIVFEPTHIFANNTLEEQVYHTRLIASSIYGCSALHVDSVRVYPLPIADFSVSAIQGCSPLELQLSDNSSIAATYAWTYGNGQSSNSNTSHSYTYVSTSTTPDNYSLELLVETEHGCTATANEQITVFPAVTASFETEEALCSDHLFTFYNQSQGAMDYQWSFGDGNSSVSNNPLHSYANTSGSTASYPVTLTATSQYQCTDQFIDTIDVFSAPIASISIDSSSVCYPLYVEFGNSTQYANSYSWNYGDGNNSNTTASSHSHIFTNTTADLITYNIVMIASTVEGCTDTAGTSVQVIPPLEAEFEFVENGCHPLEVEFVNETEGALSYDWLLEEDVNSTDIDPVHVFNNYGIEDETFTVFLVASSYFGCSDTISQDITVFPLPDAEFGVDPNLQVFPAATVNITDYSVSGATAVYTWDLDDGTVTNDPDLLSHTYSTWGSYNLSLTIDNGHCSDQSIQVVEIMAPPPVADFSGGGEGCAPVTIAFDNLSAYGQNYLWSFGDGGVTSNEEPVYTYYIPGTYTVSLLVTGPGGSEITVRDTIVHVYPNATAYYTANPEIINTGDVVFFYNLSNQATEFEWDFGDGQSSAEPNPTHIFQETGYYDVTLIADNQYNCPDTFKLADAVFVDVGGYIEFPNAFTPDPLGASGGLYDPTRLDNDIFYPIYAGVEDYKLQVYNRWGELLFESNEVGRGWDGFYKGQLVQQGVYVWRAAVTFTDGKQLVKAGDLTLLR